jgi:hypothetical protein
MTVVEFLAALVAVFRLHVLQIKLQSRTWCRLVVELPRIFKTECTMLLQSLETDSLVEVLQDLC